MSEASLPMETLSVMKQEIFRSLHCALPGTVETFDAESCTANIRLASPDLPVLMSVPVFMPVPFEVSPGDLCLVVFADMDCDRFLAAEDVTVSERRHSLSDGFAFVGFKFGREAPT